MIEPFVPGAIRRLATRGPTMGIERELVMSHRGLVTMRALWLDGPMRGGLSGRRKHGLAARHQNNDREESRHAFHCAEAFDGDAQGFIGRERTAGAAKLLSEHPLPERDLGERRQQDDFGARILRSQDQHFGLKASDVAGRHIDDADNQTTDEVSL